MVRLLVVLVVTVALLAAAAPLAITQAPRLHSPVLALVAFGVAGLALLAGIALLVRSAVLLRRSGVPDAGSVPVRADQPPADESVTEPRPGPDRIVLVPTAGRLSISVPATVTPPRHARVEASGATGGGLEASGATDQASDQEPVTVGQVDGGGDRTASQSQAQADTGTGAVEAAVDDPSAERSAAFASRYTTTRSRR